MMLGGGATPPSPAAPPSAMDGAPPQPIQNPGGIPIGGDADAANAALRFEDLTIDDDLPLLDRVVRYCRSGIALQRLVHVKMLAETAESVGTIATFRTLIPLLPPLVSDPESIIRQHLASQLLALSLTCMFGDTGQDHRDPSTMTKPRTYNGQGYQLVTNNLLAHLNALIADPDMDVRRSASESLASLALHVKPDDVAPMILPIPLRLAYDSGQKSVGAEDNGLHEELRISAANLLGELSASSDKEQMPPSLVGQYVLPTILSLCEDGSFRVRRSAVQALPRLLGGSTVEDADRRIIPAFVKLSRDDMYRVRKSTGECLVDMSRSLMLIAAAEGDAERREELKRKMRAVRRSTLIPIATQLLGDSNKFVRHGMMQFLGPFLASFYPLDGGHGDGVIKMMLEGGTSNDGAAIADGNTGGIGAQFFPHASSMVSRLNSSASPTAAAPTPVGINSINAPAEPELSELEKLQQLLPHFLQTHQASLQSLRAILAHRESHPPDAEDVAVVQKYLLQHFVALARVSTGDENTDAEMRVYCAYSFPAVVLLLGRDNWRGMLGDCFVGLISPATGAPADIDPTTITPPPLPVKRCLASSLHTVAHILGPELTESDVLPVFVQHFFRDTDESVRLNVIRHFPSLLSLLSRSLRGKYLSMWSDIVKGEDLLGAHKRSVTNPSLLNWRQRDAVARSLPHLLGLFDPYQVRLHIWPIIQMLLTDSVSLVREDTEWCIPVLFSVYCPENIGKCVRDGEEEAMGPKDCKRWSSESCEEVIKWLKKTILGASEDGGKGTSGSLYNGGGGNFSKRQLYCQICASVALALRLGSDLDDISGDKGGSSSSLDHKFQSMLHDWGPGSRDGSDRSRPYQHLSPAEQKHLQKILVRHLLPPALEMKDDRVTNVRLTLIKALRVLPEDIRNLQKVKVVIQELEDEAGTWENYHGNDVEGGAPSPPAATARAAASASARNNARVVVTSSSNGTSSVSQGQPGSSALSTEAQPANNSQDAASSEKQLQRQSSGSNSRRTGNVVMQRVAAFENAPDGQVPFDEEGGEAKRTNGLDGSGKVNYQGRGEVIKDRGHVAKMSWDGDDKSLASI